MSAALLAGIRSCRAVGGTRSVRCVAALQQPACIQAGARLMSSGTAPPERRKLSMDEVVSFCKRRGFIFPGSELYGSIGTGFDYGPLGAQLKKNIQDAWWKDFVERRPDCVGIESALIMNPRGAWGWLRLERAVGHCDNSRSLHSSTIVAHAACSLGGIWARLPVC